MNLLRGMLVIGAAVGLSACGSDTGSGSGSVATPPKVDAATLTELGACVVDRMQGGTQIDRVQVFEIGHDSALNFFIGGKVPAEPPGDPSYVLWVTGAEPPDDGIEVIGGGAGQPSGPALGVWMIEPVKRAPLVVGDSACQGDDWGVVQESQGMPDLQRLGGSVDLSKQDYDIPGPPSGSS